MQGKRSAKLCPSRDDDSEVITPPNREGPSVNTGDPLTVASRFYQNFQVEVAIPL
jgi:hypothetical protein